MIPHSFSTGLLDETSAARILGLSARDPGNRLATHRGDCGERDP